MAQSRRLRRAADPTTSAPRTVLTVVGQAIERAAVDELVRAAAPEAELKSVASLADARAWIEAGGRPALGLFQAEALGPFGVATVQGWRSACPAMRLALYGPPDAEAARRALAAGFDAVLARTTAPDQFVAALRFVLAGHRYVSPEVLAAAPDHGASCAFIGACGWALPLLDELPAGLCVVQGERVIYVNRYMVERFGYDLEQLHAMSFWDPVSDPHKDQVRDAALGWQRGEPVTPNFIVPIRTAAGELRWVESFHQVVAVAGGTAIAVVCFDVTERMSDLDRARLVHLTVAELARGVSLQVGAAPHARTLAPVALTDRQREVLDLLALGNSNKAIGAKLGISEATVKLHVHHIMRALGASNRTEAALRGRRPVP
jgi:PAS domain S-box-containing protein